MAGITVKCERCGSRWEWAFSDLYRCGCDAIYHKAESKPVRPLQGQDPRDCGTLELIPDGRKVKARQLPLL